MIRTRRISVKVEHTEVTISVTETSALGRSPSTASAAGETAQEKHCPSCGAAWLPSFQDAVRSFRLTGEQLTKAVNAGQLHLFCSPNNEIWICERSIQQMKETHR